MKRTSFFGLALAIGACSAGQTQQGDGSGGRGTGGASSGSGGRGSGESTNGSGGAGQSTGGSGAGTGGSGQGSGGSGGAVSSGGVIGSGGATGTGGLVGSGGAGAATGGRAAGSGGAGGLGGAGDGTGGATGGAAGTGAGPGITDVSTFTATACTITPTVTTAAKIPMVGIATFTTDLPSAERAIIQFGKTTAYSLEAPVDWTDPTHKTLLLGMPANTDVHYRIVVIAGNKACLQADATYKTGAPPSGAPADKPPQKGTSAVAPAPGFIIAESASFAYIVDNLTGSVVWAYKFPVSLTRALMSWDGQYMFARDVGPFDAGSGGSIYRVGMDGSGEMKLTLSGGTHHDFTVTPSGIAYPAKVAAGGCDSIFTAGVDGSSSKALVDLDVVFSNFKVGAGAQAMEKCHVNAIRYYKDTDSFSVSDREKDAIAFISSKGEVLGSVGATPTGTTPNHAKAEGADSQTTSVWRVQHGHDQYEPNKIVLWSNGPFQGGTSKILHYTISGATAKLDWQYTGTGNSPTFSDAQHLPNGNFLATNSQSGTTNEIDPGQKLVQSFTALCKGGYSKHRSSLYGPPSGR
jgi:hypothetical protein